MMNKYIQLADGAGGQEMSELVAFIRSRLPLTGKWQNTGDDGAVYSLGYKLQATSYKLVFTTDSFVVTPLFFPGGDIGKIAACGTINDLAVMGAKPLGLSLAIVLEEGFPIADLQKILGSINEVSQSAGVPIVTGDTKVVEKGKLDKIMITTAGIGLAGNNIISDDGLKPGDKIIVSGDLARHGAVLLASRFNYKTKLKSDCQFLTKEIQSVGKYLTVAKDATRGGLAAILNEVAKKSCVKIVIDEQKIPIKKEVRAICDLLGIDVYGVASEGRFVCGVRPQNAVRVLTVLKKFNKDAAIIGSVSDFDARQNNNYVTLKTLLGERALEEPVGNLIPRIC